MLKKNAICLRKCSIESFYNESKSLHLPSDSYVKYNVIHLNIRSIRANFRSLIATIGDNFNMIDILVLSEINCNAENLGKFKINGFKMISKPRPQGRGGGILIYVRDNFKIQDMQISFEYAEILCIKLNNEVLIAACYRPPSKSKPLFLEELNNFLVNTTKVHSDIIFCGDININTLVSDTIVTRYENIFLEHGFEKCIHLFPTREEFSAGNFKSTQIDHIYTRFKKMFNISYL
jgi:exonuclease III